MMNTVDGNKEIRKLQAGTLNSVIDILEINDSWQILMSKIPKNPEDLNSGPKYNSEHIRMIKDHADCVKVKATKVLFDEWGTSGQIRPTLRSLMKILVQANLFRAADAIADLLKETRPRRPSEGPAAEIDLSVTQMLQSQSIGQQSTAQMQTNNNEQTVEEQKRVTREINLPNPFQNEYNIPDIENLNPISDVMVAEAGNYTRDSNYSSPDSSSNVYYNIDSDLLTNSNLVNFDYKFLVSITKDFSSDSWIGGGGFGDVYKGFHSLYGQLAVKKARNLRESNSRVDFNKMFNREVRSLSILQHDNIVPILGFSLNGPEPCIICRFIDGGSLLDKLEAKILKENERIKIIDGVSEGLKYIHNTVIPIVTPEMRAMNKKYYFMHGDVKSANILLTNEFEPKLCDFGLAKQYTTTAWTSKVMGTSPYMAIESLQGTITQKSDVYSFGVVLLEILTGLKPVIKTVQGDVNIKNYIEENYKGDITDLLDKVAKWTKAAQIYDLAKLCLKEKEQRPTMDEVCRIMVVIKNQVPSSLTSNGHSSNLASSTSREVSVS